MLHLGLLNLDVTKSISNLCLNQINQENIFQETDPNIHKADACPKRNHLGLIQQTITLQSTQPAD